LSVPLLKAKTLPSSMKIFPTSPRCGTAFRQNLKGAVAPAKILSEQTKTTSILRDLLNEDFNKIVTNDKTIFADAKSYIQRIAPEKADIVAFHQNGTPIFDQFGVTKQVKGSFGKTVNLNSGAYLIIEHTEAFT
jgi:ribonuclease G